MKVKTDLDANKSALQKQTAEATFEGNRSKKAIAEYESQATRAEQELARLKAEAEKAKKERENLQDLLDKAKSKADDTAVRVDTAKAETETEKMMLETAKIKAETAGIKGTGVAAIQNSASPSSANGSTTATKTSTLIKDCVVRDQPETGKTVGVAKKGEKVNIAGQKGVWVQVTQPEGFMHKNCVK
jgi:uncharacterized protein YlxW (UPF0749 family)